ncbi:MAG: TonB-dependent receptor plug domain-containing protein [Flavobacteriales bacterium]|nr:TonB-dependent receptor plug domain-containing protein [Flavobacteriia bacterium]NCP05081.1 TonB-dependent receptor plug domain-containing protein [Flavobacteriales bacterium]PIV92614.1 MAG: TonB-dependent receptor [Flavobacteriaceae bacterium CG17_big_fil_post_rev_8_21_14_2_50_33_15]PIY12962.1 MAG: TonB-dependent receptor [Flavobacteriaceae bacterium CG_4_10_14_3_um_filter_33_47]PJB20072.1 MAG: TonB-dependent receptor [Flavobacteriaceae bacterium CG_4_9_14_3_um_filter_33_16]
MKKIIVILLVLVSFKLSAQQVISGIVLDHKGIPIIGANVFLEGTYDGSTTDDNGHFNFKTSETGTQTLIVSYVSFERFYRVGEVSYMKDLTVYLKKDVNTLDAVVLSAGTFQAGDNTKVNVLKPLDVVTTASALGDFVGALQTLPGTTTVAEDGRLFVRGGEAEETQIFIDGIRVFTPYTPTTNNSPTRGRYSPFLFDGITFSTGGYSAEYGQALSSVLLLNTIDEPNQDKTDIGIMSIGGSLGNTQKWETSSLSVNGAYVNLAPYIAAFPDRNDWIKPFETFSGESVFRKKFDTGLLKLYAAFDNTNFELKQEDINQTEGVHFKLKNNNLYFNGSYQGKLNDTWDVFGGMSFTRGNNDLNVFDMLVKDTETAFHAKLKFKKRFSNWFKLYFGTEYLASNFKENVSDVNTNNADYGYDDNIASTYVESDIFVSRELAFKVGLRSEYSELFKTFNAAPRLSLAYKTSKTSQVSLAYGNFYQNPSSSILKFNQNLKAQNTTHYILNYQFNLDRKIFRAEAYFKDYHNLVKYNTDFAQFDSQYNSNGYGFAKGIDLFWRDNKSIKNVDYWISYSLLDTKRMYKNYPVEAQPNFANTHNLSLVGKYWINDWRSQVGFSYSFASGRPFNNPNSTGFMNDKTKAYQSLSINWAYLISPQKILYASVNNVLGFKNINGYQYANSPNSNGVFDRRELKPAADQFFFVGFFWTISEDKKSNQLDNL